MNVSRGTSVSKQPSNKDRKNESRKDDTKNQIDSYKLLSETFKLAYITLSK